MDGADAGRAGANESTDLAHWVIRVAGAVYADLPGFLDGYGDPEAWWPIAVNMAAGLVAFGTWRWVNRRNNRPFAVVLLGLGIVTVLVLASASYAACPDAGLSRGWSVVTRVVGLLTNNYAIDMFATPSCDTDGVPLALQFARLAHPRCERVGGERGQGVAVGVGGQRRQERSRGEVGADDHGQPRRPPHGHPVDLAAQQRDDRAGGRHQ